VPSSIAHAAVAVIANQVLDRADRKTSMVWVAAIAATAPDLDTVGWVFRGGHGPLSVAHRGISHSLFVAAIAAALMTAVWNWRRPLHSPARTCGYFALVIASHGLLDWLSSYGDGVALLAPFANQRYGFYPSLFDGLLSEVLCLWLPAFVFIRLNVGHFREGEPGSCYWPWSRPVAATRTTDASREPACLDL
jgi:membrane-bound metal-dependent hydrolase YbcI (DUF457 family)